MKKVLLVAVIAVVLCSCSNQYKSEHAVKKFIEKYSTNPETYKPVQFMPVEEYKSKYGKSVTTPE